MQHPIDIADIDNGIDRQQLIRLKERFTAVSNERLARTRMGMRDRQQLVLDSLGLLFHFNHPALPGYVSQNTPCGLSQYKLDNRSRLLLRRLARSFNPLEHPHNNENIFAIYVMGSVGSIAHTNDSDLDVWVCYRPGLNREQVQLLNHKCERITRWAQTQGVEVHCFPMDCEAFKSGQKSSLGEDASGSSQHFLLLDEFYRTSIWLGGRLPLWWFVPPQREHDYDTYANTLIDKQFLRAKDVLDFGPANQIPAGEFVGAGIWHLYKGIDAPFKSVLKLLLLESYASQYPDIKTLSWQFKASVYDGKTHLDQLDAYLNLYQHLEHYLNQRGEKKRLELIRRAFYFKINCPLSKVTGNKSWHWRTLRELAMQWRWTEKHIYLMDDRKAWKAGQVKLEKHNLVHELVGSYRFISQFASQLGAQNTIDKRELETLGHKLHAAFDRKAGKIEFINPDISSNMSESVVQIRCRAQRPKQERWAVFALPGQSQSERNNLLLKQASAISELLCWSLANGVYSDQTEMLIHDAPVSSGEVKQFISALEASFDFPLPKAKHSAFLTAAKLETVMVYVNLSGESPQPRGHQNLDASRDAFNFGATGQSLVSSIDLVCKNSWNELSVFSLTDSPVAQFALKLTQLCYQHDCTAVPQIFLFTNRSQHSSIITARMSEFIADIKNCLQVALKERTQRGFKLVFETDEQLHLLTSGRLKPALASFDDIDSLLRELQLPNALPSDLHIDSHALNHSPIKIIARDNHPGIAVYAEVLAEHRAQLYFVDQHKNLTILRLPFGQLEFLLRAVHHFLRQVILHEPGLYSVQRSDFGVFPIKFFRVFRQAGKWQITKPIPVASDAVPAPTFDVQAIVLSVDGDEVDFRLVCDQYEFTGDQQEQLLAASKFIQARRQSKAFYPLHLNDLDLSAVRDQVSDTGQLLLADYLRIKHQIEHRLNAARLKLGR